MKGLTSFPSEATRIVSDESFVGSSTPSPSSSAVSGPSSRIKRFTSRTIGSVTYEYRQSKMMEREEGGTYLVDSLDEMGCLDDFVHASDTHSLSACPGGGEEDEGLGEDEANCWIRLDRFGRRQELQFQREGIEDLRRPSVQSTCRIAQYSHRCQTLQHRREGGASGEGGRWHP
jgi:hypothetical protein